MGGPKAKAKKKPEQEMIAYSEFTKKPNAKMLETVVPIKNGKLAGDVQIAWITHAEDESGKISTVWHVLSIDRKFAEEHLIGVDPAVIQYAMSSAASGKNMSEIEKILTKGMVEKPKPKPLPFTGVDEKGVPYLEFKVPKPKPLPYTHLDEKGRPVLVLKPKKEPEKAMPEKKYEKAAEAEKPEKKPPEAKKEIEKPAEKPKEAEKYKPPKKEESLLSGIAAAETAGPAELGKIKAEEAKAKIETEKPIEKAIMGNIEIAKTESKPTATSSSANKMLETTDVVFTTLGATEETKFSKILAFYYNKLGKEPGASAIYRYGSVPFTAANGEKLKFFILVTTADFEKAGVADIKFIKKKEKQEAIDKMTDGIFQGMVKWLGAARLPKEDYSGVKAAIKTIVTQLVEGIIEERSKVIELSG